MGYKVNKLQNDMTNPTIVITEFDKGWNEAYKTWLSGKNPTDSVEWKKAYSLRQSTA